MERMNNTRGMERMNNRMPVKGKARSMAAMPITPAQERTDERTFIEIISREKGSMLYELEAEDIGLKDLGANA
jgi:hypothetical protein